MGLSQKEQLRMQYMLREWKRCLYSHWQREIQFNFLHYERTMTNKRPGISVSMCPRKFITFGYKFASKMQYWNCWIQIEKKELQKLCYAEKFVERYLKYMLGNTLRMNWEKCKKLLTALHDIFLCVLRLDRIQLYI